MSFPGLSLNPGNVVGKALKRSDEKKNWPLDVAKVPIPFWDTGVFLTELSNLNHLPAKMSLTSEDRETLRHNPEALFAKADANAPDKLKEGTVRGTQLALTKVYQLIEKSYESFMDAANFEPSFPHYMTIEQKRARFEFTDPTTDGYPPHLNLGAANKEWSDATPGSNQKTTLKEPDLFSAMRLAQLTALLPSLVPDTFIDHAKAGVGQFVSRALFGGMGRPDEGNTLADVENYQTAQRKKDGGFFDRNDIFNLPNIGDIKDWYSDRRFAQQFFTGTNPTTIELASDRWIEHFIHAATDSPGDQKMKKKIQDLSSKDRTSLYVQDYSYFRKAAGMQEGEEIFCEFEETYKSGLGTKKAIHKRYGMGSVCLFHLHPDGQLRPLAIVLDWLGSAEKSVTIYNKELSLSDQRTDWPWRYAKTCVQTSDWLRHEVTVHLTLTHLIEEATIVGANRSFEDGHPVLQLLYPHWQKTLSVNAGARATLIPKVIIDLVGLTTEQAKQFIRSEYENFDFKGRYVPLDLERRGFPTAKRDEPKYQQYAYARCIYSMWFKIRSFVEEMLALHYGSGATADNAVAADKCVQDWVTIMQAPTSPNGQGGANIKSFPTISTFVELVDAVTMCIHLASPQHTAVNYLQNYYQSFVVNKPPCLYRPLPTSREELDHYKEQNLVDALPMNHPREWLLASHIPYLLSAKPGDKESLIIYAASKYNVYKEKHGKNDQAIKEAAAKFYQKLAESEAEFDKIADDCWDADDVHYDVLSPTWNAVSIVI
ncbi:unnamed protein product [Zymoseptoria tritici ST99CH_1A5]|uniref:Manganese lipoxygenase n=2 Tax=Zymoseptoria tritici TaxID=1047171 RepID=A0A1X7RE29_ZYMT9|nr:unnamed protein product [Zymoseptoria tritici ST99CH_3D7]SMY18973.1 unnamed protein product [Zymoseptoria tritici ST99CH_1A5]